MRIARTNRVLLCVVGTALLVAAGFVLARAEAVRPKDLGTAHSPFVNASTRAFAHDHGWFWPVMAAVAVVVALLCLWWMAAQARPRALRGLRRESDTRRGTTTMPATVLTEAVEDDLSVGPDLRRPRAQLTGSARRPRLRVFAGLPPDADPAAVRDRVHETLARMREAVETDEVPTVVRLGRR